MDFRVLGTGTFRIACFLYIADIVEKGSDEYICKVRGMERYSVDDATVGQTGGGREYLQAVEVIVVFGGAPAIAGEFALKNSVRNTDRACHVRE